MIVAYWKNARTEVQGKLHVENNIVCQDKTYFVSNEGIRVMSLSDGAGSKKHSHIGAEVTTKAICDYVLIHFDRLYKDHESNEKRNSDVSLELSKVITQSLEKASRDKNIPKAVKAIMAEYPIEAPKE